MVKGKEGAVLSKVINDEIAQLRRTVGRAVPARPRLASRGDLWDLANPYMYFIHILNKLVFMINFDIFEGEKDSGSIQPL